MLKKQEKTENVGKRLECLLLMLVIVLTLFGTQNTVQVSAAASTKVGNAWYTILSEEDGTAQYMKPSSKTLKSASVPDTVKIGQKTYKVSSIACNAFKNNKKLAKATIGKNVTAIGKNAFYGCKNLKTITIKTTGLMKSSVGSKAFKGLNAKAVATVPSEKLATYKSILKNAGFSGKNQKVIGEKNSAEANSVNSNDSSASSFDQPGEPWENYDSSQPLPDPKSSAFTIPKVV